MNAFEQARKHAIRREGPAATFFEGALLGNGGLGAVVATRPDAIVVHFGHNDVWDIRIAEEHQDEIGKFDAIFEKLKAIPGHYASLTEDEWYRNYVAMTAENYAFPYPRPMPCGSLLLGFDPRETEVLGHTLHVQDGLCEIRLLTNGRETALEVFVDQEADRLWLRMKDEGFASALPIFDRIKLIPDPETPKELPVYTYAVSDDRLAFRQSLPSSSAGVPGKAFKLSARISGAVGFAPGESVGPEARIGSLQDGWTLCAELEEGLYSEVPAAERFRNREADDTCEAAYSRSLAVWTDYWSRSGVALGDEYLESVWYRNLYFFQCSVKPEATCPGLFANWSYGKIGSEWHGDYHMNYNTQQPFWLAFSSNHADKHLAYANMVDGVLPVSRKWAKEYYGLRGAFFPHSAYPVAMNMMPYPVPHWGWEVCETPWTVQSLWWHYLYTMDLIFLADRAFEPIKDAVLFMVDYLKRPDASGAAWGDDRYHVFPTVVPELYELTPGFGKNRDCIIDLALTKFLFRAFAKSCEALGREAEEAELLADAAELLRGLADYPTASSRRGTVFVSVQNEDPEVVYNVPVSLATVFPGEEHGLHSSKEEYEIAVATYRNHRNEGGNDLVYLPMAGARLGVLDLERFKRQIAYCMLPNGTCTGKVLLAGGRYSDTTPFDFMAPMGVWFENFALPAVVNECLLQSYTGILRFFPNWPAEKDAEFSTLRAAGGFLVSASLSDGEVQWIEIFSEAGSELRYYDPWDGGEVRTVPTAVGQTVRLVKKG